MAFRERSVLPRLVVAATLSVLFTGTLSVPAALAVPKPVVSSFSPTSGPVGTLVTISGQNFTGVTGVTFRNIAAVFTFVSDIEVKATVPAGARTGPIHVMTPAGTGTSSQDFTVTGASPVISSFSPSSGGPGTSVTILGSGLSGATQVRFGGVSAVFNVNSDTKITTAVPVGAQTGPIQVVTPAGTATSASNFVVSGGGAPSIASFSPTSGPVGTLVTILGSGFSGTTKVTFATVPAVFTVSSDTKITATVPTGAATGRIKVVTPNGTATSAASFKVTSGAAPTIMSFSPTSGPIGATVVIRGDHLTGTTAVTFNGVSAVFTVNSDTKITATVPVGATTGRIKVTTPAATGTSSTNFRVTTALPVISSVSPTTGRVGTVVTLLGTNFAGATHVRFGDREAGFTVVSPTQITAVVPAGASTGTIRITTPAGTVVGPRFSVFHARALTLRLRGDLVARGRVRVRDGYGACAQGATVLVQRSISGSWRTIARAVSAGDGSYRADLPGAGGEYRTLVERWTRGSGDICGRAASRGKTH